ncbi:MAG: 3-hydroxyacyl-CoA dehydrogenase/enoyl-CoA hydratase family protein [Acidobacteriota bacterium]
MFVHKAAVVGGGTMGGQIAQAIANSDTPVVIKDVDQKFVDHAIEEVRNVTQGQLAGLVKKEKLTQEQADARLEEVLGLVTGTVSYEQFSDVDFVIEAVPEKMAIKQAVFAELDAVTPGHAILSSNTSGLSISEMAESTLRPDKVVGFHFFYPASVMPLVEVIIGDETTSETVQVASNFAQDIGKQPITCGEVPGFVVNRILNSAVGEIWRAQEERGLSIKKIDEGVAAANVAPMGPFVLGDMLGLDTVYHVAEHLSDSYGGRFYVHQGMKQKVAEGKLGVKTGGEGLYKDGEPQVAGDADADADELADMFVAKALIEACLLLEEGVASVRDIDVGLMAGAGLDPRRGLFPPFWKADIDGLDVSLERIERLNSEYGDERFPVPVTLRRLVAQGRLGFSAGQGFYPYPQPDEGDQPDKVKLETRGDIAIAWLANPPMNAISPEVIQDLGAVWEKVKANDEVGAMVIASTMPIVFSAGADIKAFTKMDTPEAGAGLIDSGHALLKEFGSDRVVTIASVNSIAFGGGCEVAMACDFRIAAESAVFGQPEIKLGLIPGFGGTQRLPRLVGANKALEMNLVGDPISSLEALDFGLVTRVVPDQELFDTATNWARRLAGQAPLAVEQVKQVSFAGGDTDEGIEAEKQGFAKAFFSEDGKEGISAFLGKRSANWQGK